MNMDDDTNGQPIVWPPALSDAAQRRIDKAPPPMDQTLDDPDILALMPPAQPTIWPRVWPGL